MCWEWVRTHLKVTCLNLNELACERWLLLDVTKGRHMHGGHSLSRSNLNVWQHFATLRRTVKIKHSSTPFLLESLKLFLIFSKKKHRYFKDFKQLWLCQCYQFQKNLGSYTVKFRPKKGTPKNALCPKSKPCLSKNQCYFPSNIHCFPFSFAKTAPSKIPRYKRPNEESTGHPKHSCCDPLSQCSVWKCLGKCWNRNPGNHLLHIWM